MPPCSSVPVSARPCSFYGKNPALNRSARSFLRKRPANRILPVWGKFLEDGCRRCPYAGSRRSGRGQPPVGLGEGVARACGELAAERLEPERVLSVPWVRAGDV